MGNYASTVINIALAEVGYLEKKDGNLKYLYDKTANSGTANYTKYGKEMHDTYPEVMDYPSYWCASFVSWCFYKAYGVSTAKTVMNGAFDDYTVAEAQAYKNKNAYYKKNPKIGDQIFFNNGTKICHTGLVYMVDASKVYTVEGNTSSAAGVVSNGGGVALKEYKLSYSKIDGYGRPKYEEEIQNQKFVSGGVDYSLVFDPTYYTETYADLKAAFGSNEKDLFSHFISSGMNEKRQAIATFNVTKYASLYLDLRNAFGSNYPKYYVHYITDGHREGRVAI